MKTLELSIAAYFMNSVWQMPFVVAAGVFVVRLLHHCSPRTEHRLWVATLTVATVLPACNAGLGNLLPWLLRTFGGILAGPGSSAVPHVQVVLSEGAAQAHRVVRLSPHLLAVMAAAYGCAMLGLFLRLAIGYWRMTAIVQRANPLVLAGEPARIWARCCRLFRIPDPQLAVSPEFSGPVLAGARNLVVPTGFLDRLSEPEIEALLAHEFAHMQRRDYGRNLACELLALPVAYHPALWLLRARLAESREMACDAMAAHALGSSQEGGNTYARSLLRLAERLLARPRATHLHAIGIFDANTLERRIMRLTQKSIRITGARKLASGMACILVGTLTCASALALQLGVTGAAPETTSGRTVLIALPRLDLTGAAPENTSGRTVGFALPRLFLTGADPETTSKEAKTQEAATAPKLIYASEPDYPAEARAEKHPVSGVSTIGLTVSAEGLPQDVHVVKSLRDDFDENAMQVVREYRFKPAMKDGKPVAEDLEIQVNFQIF